MVKIGRIVKRFLKNSKNSVRNWTVLRLKIEVCRSLQAKRGLAMQSFCTFGVEQSPQFEMRGFLFILSSDSV